MPTFSEEDLIRQLKYIGPGSNDLVPVTGWDVFQRAISYTQKEYDVFVQSLITSTKDIVNDDDRARAVRVLQGTLNSIHSIRLHTNKLIESPSNGVHTSGISSETRRDIAAGYEALYREGTTMIGPVILSQSESPILDISVSEEYDVAVLKTLRGITDPVAKGSKNKIVMTLTIEFPGISINGEKDPEDPPYPSSLRRLLAVLRTTPVVEISSDTITPVFLNSILTPDLQEMVRKQVSEAVVNGENRSPSVIDYIDQTFASGPTVKLKRPSTAPNINTLTAVTVTAVTLDPPMPGVLEDCPSGVEDGDTIYVTPPQNGSHAVRLIGYNSPEVAHEWKGTNDEPGGPEDRTRLQALVQPGDTVYLEFESNTTDKYGRSLCYAYLSDGTQLNLKMVQEGNGKPFPIAPNTKYDTYYRDAYLERVYPKYATFKKMNGETNMIADQVTNIGKPPMSSIPGRSSLTMAQNWGLDRSKRADKSGGSGNFSVAAAFAGFLVYTEPKKRNSLIAKLTFIKFNDSAFQTGKLLYRDRDGNKTTNVLECPWIDKLARYMYLGPAARDSKDSVHYMEPYYVPGELSPLIEFSWEDPYSNEIMEYVPDHTTCIVTDVKVQGGNKMVTIPLVGEVHPVCQFMGVESLIGTVTMEFYSRLELARFHEMKAELDRINYDSSPVDRKSVVRIKNNVLNFIGGKTFVITRIDTSIDNSRNCHVVNFQVVESRVSARQAEAISLRTGDQSTLKDLRTTWKYIGELLRRRDRAGNFISLTDPDYTDISVLDLRLAGELVFGVKKDGVGTILNSHGLAATYYSMVVKPRSNEPWNTDTIKGDTVKRIFKDSIFVSTLSGLSLPTTAGVEIVLEDARFDNDFIRSIIGRETPPEIDPINVLFADPDKKADYRQQDPVTWGRWPAGGWTAIQEAGENMIGDMATKYRQDIFVNEEAWNKYFDVVMFEGKEDMNPHGASWTQSNLAVARSALLSLAATGLMYRFSGLNGKLETATSDSLEQDILLSSKAGSLEAGSEGSSIDHRSNYADIDLPTYSFLFGREEVANSEGIKIPLWKKFAPTFDDLGKDPPFDLKIALSNRQDAYGLVARNINDRVEPDLPYWHERRKRAAESTTDGKDALIAALNYIKANSISLTPEEIKTGVSLRDVFASLSTSPGALTNKASSDRQPDREKIKELENGKRNVLFLHNEGSKVIVVKKGGGDNSSVEFDIKRAGANRIYQAGVGDFALDPLSPDYLSSSQRSLVSRYPDRTLSMLRLFPAYRLYFVEEDRETAYLADDLYGSNAVISLHLRKEKDAPDVLTAQISNTTNNLGNEGILPDDTAERLGINKDDEGEKYFSRLKLQPGVTVQLRMGYGGRSEDLDIVFTGQITEVEPGNVVTIVAQGHKRELLNEVQFLSGSTTYFDVIQKILLRSTTPHLGRTFTVDEKSDQEIQKLIGSSIDSSNLYGTWAKLLQKESSSSTQNIFLESSQKLGTKFFGEMAPGWVVPSQPAWEALKEVTRHFPDHIIEVAPRGVDGTIFMGKPNQPYLAETPLPRETFLYESLQGKKVRAETQNIENELIQPFCNPGERNYRDYLNDLKRSFARISGVGVSGSFGDARIDLDEINLSRNTSGINGAFSLRIDTEAINSGARKNVEDLAAYPDYTSDVKYLNDINSNIFPELFYSFFGIDQSTTSTTGISSSIQLLYLMFYSGESKNFKDFVSSLSNNEIFAVDKKLLKDRDSIDSNIDFAKTVLKGRLSSGIISQKEYDRAVLDLANTWSLPSQSAEIERPGDPTSRVVDGLLSQDILARGGAFKRFVHHFTAYIKDSKADNVDLSKTLSTLDTLFSSSLPPGWRVFRNYHSLGNRDIVSNDLSASTQDMANCVLIRAPDSKSVLPDGYGIQADTTGTGEQETVTVNYEETQWVSYPTNDGLAFNEKVAKSNRKLVVVPELNATREEQKSKTLYSNMALSLRPMYKGTLTVLGRHIKPYDVVFVNDPEKDLAGHIEVNAVTHHFTADTGWITVIEPHALVDVNNPTARIELSAIQKFLDAVEPVMNVLDVGLTVLMAASLVGSLGVDAPIVAAGAAIKETGVAAAKGAAEAIIEEAAKKGAVAATKAWAKRAAIPMIRKVGGHFARNFGRYGRSVAGTGLGFRAGRLLNNILVKNSLGSTNMPLEVHLLVYRGQAFQAGLDVEDEDIYSNEDRLTTAWDAIKNTIGDNIYSICRNLPVIGRGSLHPLDRFKRDKGE